MLTKICQLKFVIKQKFKAIFHLKYGTRNDRYLIVLHAWRGFKRCIDPCFTSIPPKNFKKLPVFLCFQGYKSEILVENRLNSFF